MARSERESDAGLHGSLKQQLSLLSEAQLLQLYSWIVAEIPRARVRGPRLVSSPGRSGPATDLTRFEGSLAELAGSIRRSVHDLPEASLIVLNKWVIDQLRNYHFRVDEEDVGER